MPWRLLSFQRWAISHCLDGPQFIFPFTYRRTPCLHSRFGHYEYSCCKHPCSGFCVDGSFPLLWDHSAFKLAGQRVQRGGRTDRVDWPRVRCSRDGGRYNLPSVQRRWKTPVKVSGIILLTWDVKMNKNRFLLQGARSLKPISLNPHLTEDAIAVVVR